MTRWVAFLRGVNLGKRQMKMAELKACCEEIGLEDVRTILASGNVRFETNKDAGLRQRLETALEQRFDFPVKVILRSAEEIEAMIASQPFAAVDPAADVALHVLLSDAPMLPRPKLDDVLPAHVEVPRFDDRELYLVAHRLPNGRYTEGLEPLGKALPKGLVVTMRNWNTMLKLLG
jgi:uncharacterized protein (DUF1697 family)